MNKHHVGVICGGPSAEHEVSLQSARNIVNAIDRDRFDVSVIGVDKTGRWHAVDGSDFLYHADDPRRIALKHGDDELAIVPGREHAKLIDTQGRNQLADLDVVFPIIHGTFGEDGTLQGLLRAADLACVGSSVLGSSAAMDKDVTKRLLRDAGLMVAPFACFNRTTAAQADHAQLTAELGQPLFVKPANQGSSVGVSRVTDEASFRDAMALALSFDHKVLVESAVVGREIECAVLGNDLPEASTCGEVVISDGGFYSYDSKYVDADVARVLIPAELDLDSLAAIREVSLRGYMALECAGLARVDVFLQPDGQVVINEINTLPGFTRISMYPKLWQASGLSYSALVSRLIDLALARHADDQRLRHTL
ncbi:MAG: D-alanine--D-alanine ligase [Salinisphaera sp.]|jgi:D-alanine-D-alanine ligase|nr:D-alanine--D-alanine ligase [Salinisphaera sp.]